MQKINDFLKKIGSYLLKFLNILGKYLLKILRPVGSFIMKNLRSVGRFIMKILRPIGKGLVYFFTLPVFIAIARFFVKIYKPTLGRLFGYIGTLFLQFIAWARKTKNRKIIWGIVFVLPIMIGFVYFFLFPLIYVIIYSFSYVEIGKDPIWVGFDNYTYVFTIATTTNALGVQATFGEFLTTAIINIVVDVPIILIFSMIMAVVLNSKFRGRAIARSIFFIPVIFNSRAIDIAVSSYTILANMTSGATNDLFAQMFSFETFMLNANVPVSIVSLLANASARIYQIISYSGVQILIFLSAIQSVPKHLYEAAKMEGCTQYEMFWKITFPMISPMMLAAAVYTVVDSFLRSPILKIMALYGNTRKQTLSSGIILGISGVEGSGEILYKLSNYGISAAMSVIFSLAVIVLMAIILGILRLVVFYYDE